MLVKIRRHWARHLRTIALLTALPAACSVVVGDLPEPLSPIGPMAGDASAESGGSSGAGADTLGGSGDYSPGGGASGGDGPLMTGGVANSGQGGDLSAQGGAQLGGADGAGGAGTIPDPCDVDRDKHRAQGLCGGDDCDDGDPQVSPEQAGYFASRQPNVDFDYNCDDAPEQEQMAAVVCSTLSACPTGTSGFLDVLPACGEVGAWGKCVKTPPLNTCDKMVIDAQRRMRCR
jgi:hypothetical protein